VKTITYYSCSYLAVEKEISPYGDSVNPARAPETITNAVASLPPEQMFELMKQMKVSIKVELFFLKKYTLT